MDAGAWSHGFRAWFLTFRTIRRPYNYRLYSLTGPYSPDGTFCSMSAFASVLVTRTCKAFFPICTYGVTLKVNGGQQRTGRLCPFTESSAISQTFPDLHEPPLFLKAQSRPYRAGCRHVPPNRNLSSLPEPPPVPSHPAEQCASQRAPVRRLPQTIPAKIPEAAEQVERRARPLHEPSGKAGRFPFPGPIARRSRIPAP